MWAFILLGLLSLVGLALFSVGVLGNKKTTERWGYTGSAAHPEVSMLIVVFATPLYFFLRLIERD